MVFQKSNPLPKSIYENVVYGLRVAGIRDKATLDDACERSLRGAALWDEVKDRLRHQRPVALRRPAAAALHRARDRDRAGDHPDGRAVLGARPDRDAEDRRADPRAEVAVHDRHRDPQPAAGGARLGPDGVLLARPAGRVLAAPPTCSPTRRTSTPRTTSRADSARLLAVKIPALGLAPRFSGRRPSPRRPPPPATPPADPPSHQASASLLFADYTVNQEPKIEDADGNEVTLQRVPDRPELHQRDREPVADTSPSGSRRTSRAKPASAAR